MTDEAERDTRDGEPKAVEAEARGGRTGAHPDETFYCDLCGNAMLNLHCKLICQQCGYKRDCSDP